MKYLLFLLLIAFLITAGCVGGNKSNLTPTQTNTITVNSTVPTTIPTPTPVFITYLTGNSTCLSEPENTVYQICLDNDTNVSIKNNIITASGTLFYKNLSLGSKGTGMNPGNHGIPGAPFFPGTTSAGMGDKSEISVSLHLKTYNNNSVKVAEVSKLFSVDKDGKTLVNLNTEISENNPIGWTYLINVEKNPNEVITTTPTQYIPTLRPLPLCTATYQWYRNGDQVTVTGYVKNDGVSGTCSFKATLMFDNVEINSNTRSFSLSGGEAQSFTMAFVDKTYRGNSIKGSII
jgi:hypothetical protein